MCRQNHGVAVDYFAVGVIAYECMLGRRPYLGKSRKEIRDQILAKQVSVKKHEIPDGWSVEAADFINKVSFNLTVQTIQRKPISRLGLNGPADVKAHPWFKSFDWEGLKNKKTKAPYIPPAEDNFDQKHINENWKDDEEAMRQNSVMLRRDSV